MQAKLGLAEAMRDSGQKEVAALKAEADRILAEAMKQLRESRGASPPATMTERKKGAGQTHRRG